MLKYLSSLDKFQFSGYIDIEFVVDSLTYNIADLSSTNRCKYSPEITDNEINLETRLRALVGNDKIDFILNRFDTDVLQHVTAELAALLKDH